MTMEPANGQARLVLVDSMALYQDEQNFLARPISVTPDREGYLVVDGVQPHVFRYGPNGAFLQRYGRFGEGPGEFKQAVEAVPFGGNYSLLR
jgi:hypothetical protein